MPQTAANRRTPLLTLTASVSIALSAWAANPGLAAAGTLGGPAPTTSHMSDKTPPTLMILNQVKDPATGAVTISGMAGDNRSLSMVKWSKNTGDSGAAALQGLRTAATWSFVVSQLKAGNNTITVKAVDDTGNQTSRSIVLSGGAGPYYWQIYEVSGLGSGDAVRIAKVANQPENYNNVSPLYGTDNRILFTSDRPRNGERHLYPQRDEYESVATVTGIWSINPAAPNGDLRLLNHTPSGAFSLSIDSFGRVIFARWDHLQRDQQNDLITYGAFNFSDESAGAQRLTSAAEFFPERRAQGTDLTPLGRVNRHTFNHFAPWQINEDGTEEETLNHLGRHELNSGYMPPSFADDPALSFSSADNLHANRKFLREDGGMFHIQEDPRTPGTYYGINAREFGSLTTNQIIKINGAPGVNPESMVVTNVTMPGIDGNSPEGRFRNPLPLEGGALIAAHTPATSAAAGQMTEMRLRQLTLNPATGLYQAGPALTNGIAKTVFGPGGTYSGNLWEIEPTEVRARTRPVRAAATLEAPERAVLTEENIDESALRAWMKANDLALIVTRNQTSRDRADKQQPFNLRVPGGTSRVAPGTNGPTYDIAHLQIIQADQLRGYANGGGRRVLGQPMHDPKVKNPARSAASRSPLTAPPPRSYRHAARLPGKPPRRTEHRWCASACGSRCNRARCGYARHVMA